MVQFAMAVGSSWAAESPGAVGSPWATGLRSASGSPWATGLRSTTGSRWAAGRWCVREAAVAYGGDLGATCDDATCSDAACDDDTYDDATDDEVVGLGERIADLARGIQAAEYEMLRLLAEFDDRRGWEAYGFGSCAEWLAWRIGSKLNGARERVRAAHALVHLPQTSAAMQAGTLSFSKVRALTRVATPENEEALLEFAHAGSASNLERVVRAWKALNDREELGLEQVRHRNRSFSVFVGDDGSYIVKGRLEPEVGAVLMRAVEAASDALFRREDDGATEGVGAGGGDAPDVTPAQRRADAVGLLCERALTSGFDGAVSGSRAERYQVMLHVEPETVRGDVESGRSELDGVRVCGETSRRMTCDASVVEVVEDGGGAEGPRVTAVKSGVGTSPAVTSPARPEVLGVGRRTRTIPPALRRALQARDRGCRFPGCGCRFTDAHHVIHWADGGRTDLKNLVLLCRRHHRAVHEGGMRVCLDTEGKVAFFTPSGRAIFDAPRGGRAPGDIRGGGRRPEALPSPEPLPSPPTPLSAYPGADRWDRDADIPWSIEARAMEALDC